MVEREREWEEEIDKQTDRWVERRTTTTVFSAKMCRKIFVLSQSNPLFALMDIQTIEISPLVNTTAISMIKMKKFQSTWLLLI